MRIRHLLPALLGLLVLAPGCTTLQQIAALRQVDFDIDRVNEGFLAGVDLDRVRSYGDLGPIDIARLTAAAARQEMPLAFVLHLDAENPSSNSVAARLVQLDWTLLIDDTETVSGIFNDERLIEPGTTTDIPIGIELDLVRFFGSNARDLIDLGLNLAGAGGSPARLSLRARPTVNTAIGPITYPGYITISHTVGN
jgi:hypothetical protein